MPTPPTKTQAAMGFLSNPVVLWTLAIGGAILAARWLLPMAYSGAKAGVNKVGTDVVTGVGDIYTAIGDTLGYNPNQNPKARTLRDEAIGTFSADKGDRSLSDIFDFLTFNK